MGCGSQGTLKKLRVSAPPPRLSLRSQLRSQLRFPLRPTPRSPLRSLFYSVHCGKKKTKFSVHSWQLLNKYYTNDLIQMPKVKPGCLLTVPSSILNLTTLNSPYFREGQERASSQTKGLERGWNREWDRRRTLPLTQLILRKLTNWQKNWICITY